MPLNPDQLIRDEIRALAAYHVPDAAGYVKLDAMENPYRLPDDLRAALGQLASEAAINRYPDAAASKLKARLRESMQIPAGMEILLGNGSDEIIQILAMAIAKPGATILGLEPSFVMYRMIAAYVGARYVGVPLKADFTLDIEATLAAIAEHQPALTFIAYPNNPTGNLFDAAQLTRILDAAPGLVVMDEAYHVFAQTSFLSRLTQYPNLLVMRTLSKLGLAGLRLGFLVGSPAWLNELDKLRLPYNVNVLTQQVAECVLARPDVLEQQAAAIRAERTQLMQALERLPGVTAFPSAANFILFRVAQADAVFDKLKGQGILIKNLSRAHPQLADCLRVTVGTPDENRQFLTALGQSL
ncbi:MAG: histidinol-phosphate transaminase [Betaproteobacteria bacterium RBG_19FT_COMBO_58_11]|nr:MAG: histidinol-phosphate transaminase [Betaproteobacteria bacterium RBG_19FT_COMBO_58_11]